MSQDVVVLAVHGMGDTQPDFADGLRRRLMGELAADWSSVYFDTIYYQGVLQPHQRAMMDRMKRAADLDYTKLRRFLLFGFSDAAGLERNASSPGSRYHMAQIAIRDTLIRAFEVIGTTRPVIIIAQSLGCQVISNYLWDAQKPRRASRGVWAAAGARRTSARDRFLRLRSLRFLYSTGCNIPIFLAGFPQDQIKAVATATKGYDFRWKNFYDEDDILGWPLKPICPSYRRAIHRDYAINAGSILTSWNPLSHDAYWGDGDVIDPLVRDIRSLIG